MVYACLKGNIIYLSSFTFKKGIGAKLSFSGTGGSRPSSPSCSSFWNILWSTNFQTFPNVGGTTGSWTSSFATEAERSLVSSLFGTFLSRPTTGEGSGIFRPTEEKLSESSPSSGKCHNGLDCTRNCE